MTATALIREINKLPLGEKMLVVEKTIKSIKEEKSHDLAFAVKSLHGDYKSNKELTEFTLLDAESFYEAK